MDVLKTPPPELNPNDISTSFRRITDYLYKVMEDIDFTLGKNRKQINEADGSAEGLQNQINGVRGDLVLLSNAVVSMQNRLNTLSDKVGQIEGTLESFDQRISALENPTP